MKKNDIKKITVLLALVLCVATMTLALTGCGGDKATDIYITKADMPRMEYVEGQELDLSDGRLTVVSGDGEQKVALTDPQVTVSGYDKNKLGDQNVTIQYGGLTTSIVVTVKARVVASNFETSYFVGDSFNSKIGKLQITTDDMKTISVNMNDERVSVVSFDSSKAGLVDVTVRYTEGSNTYEGQFSVVVYEGASVEFSAPDKTHYNSYDTGLDVSGGYFTVTSSDGKLTKQVPLREDLVTGFDLSAATIEHRENPLVQNVKVNYLGKEFTYEIQISFGGVSVIDYYMSNGLNTINWESAKTEGLPEDISRIAIDAIQEYYRLTAKQREAISGEVKTVVSRAGAIAVFNAFHKELEKFSDTLGMDAMGNLYFLTPTYEQAKRDLAKFTDPMGMLHVYADLLRDIREEFGDQMLDDEMTIGGLITVYTEDTEMAVMDVLDHLLGIHELTADIPLQWNAETLKAYGDKLMQVAMQIYNAGYHKNGFASYYLNVLAHWREQEDLFEILYTYFLYDYEDDGEFLRTYLWGNVPLPGKLQTWYSSLSTAAYYADYFRNTETTDSALADTTPFMFYYLQTLELAEEIKNSDDPLLTDLYAFYYVEQMNYDYLYRNPSGYLHVLKGMEDSEAVNTLWDKYFQVLKLYGKELLSSQEHETQLKEMYSAFEQLNPSELLGFLTSISNNYSNARGTLPLLSYDEETAYVMFTSLLRDYYVPYLHEANQPLFAALLQAMENFALIGFKDSASSQFTSLMASLVSNYNALSAEDKANFDQYAGVGYTKYLTYYQLMNNYSGLVLTEQESKLFAELELVLNEYIFAYTAIRNSEQTGQTVAADAYAVTCALRSRANELYNAILEIASPDALKLLFVRAYDMQGNRLTLAQSFFLVDEYCVSMMEAGSVNITLPDGTVQQVAAWDIYTQYDIADILSEMAHLLYQCYFCDEITVDGEFIISLMATMRELTPAQRSLLSVMGASDAYYQSIGRYLNTVLSDGAQEADVVANILNAEIAYTAYSLNEDNAQYYDHFVDFMDQLIAVYDRLTETDKQYIGDAYSYYLHIYEQLKKEVAA